MRENFERFQYFNFETDFLENENLFQKTEALRLKTYHFHTKLQYQKPMLRQMEWWLQNGLFKNSGFLPVTTLFFWKFYFSLWTSYKEMICCTNYPNAHICAFCKSWSINRRWFSLWLSLIMDLRIYNHLQIIDEAYEHYERLRIQWRFILAIAIICSRLRLWAGYFIYFKFTLVFF